MFTCRYVPSSNVSKLPKGGGRFIFVFGQQSSLYRSKLGRPLTENFTIFLLIESLLKYNQLISMVLKLHSIHAYLVTEHITIITPYFVITNTLPQNGCLSVQSSTEEAEAP